jgi:hypothetical protein
MRPFDGFARCTGAAVATAAALCLSAPRAWSADIAPEAPASHEQFLEDLNRSIAESPLRNGVAGLLDDARRSGSSQELHQVGASGVRAGALHEDGVLSDRIV